MTELMRLPPMEELGEEEIALITLWVLEAENAENGAKQDRSQPAGEHAHLIVSGQKLMRDAPK